MLKMNRDSNSYTFLFATIMVFIVASTLAFTASSLKKKQDEMLPPTLKEPVLESVSTIQWV